MEGLNTRSGLYSVGHFAHYTIVARTFAYCGQSGAQADVGADFSLSMHPYACYRYEFGRKPELNRTEPLRDEVHIGAVKALKLP